MLTTLAGMFGGQIIDRLFSEGAGLFKAYFDKQITEAQLKSQLLQLLVTVFGEIEKAHADALARTYASFMDATKTSPVMQRAWSFVVYSQTAVLIWHQVGIPLVVLVAWQWWPQFKYPSSGSTVEWAYLLLGLCLGAGVFGLRSGPGAGDIAGRLKSLTGK